MSNMSIKIQDFNGTIWRSEALEYARAKLARTCRTEVMEVHEPAGRSSTCRTESSGGTRPKVGCVDEVRIYNRSLSASEITDHYNNQFNDEIALVLWICETRSVSHKLRPKVAIGLASTSDSELIFSAPQEGAETAGGLVGNAKIEDFWIYENSEGIPIYWRFNNDVAEFLWNSDICQSDKVALPHSSAGEDYNATR